MRDQQPFLPSDCLSQEAIAAIAAEAQFFGLHDLTAMLMTKQHCTRYKYKYVRVHNESHEVYVPKLLKNTQQRQNWEQSWEQVERDEANLDSLQQAGWEYVCSHLGDGLTLVVVLRRME